MNNTSQQQHFMLYPYAEAFWTEDGAKRRAEVIAQRLYERHLLARVYREREDDVHVVAVVFLVLPSQLRSDGRRPGYVDRVLAGRGGKPVRLSDDAWHDIIQDAMKHISDTQGQQLQAIGDQGTAEIDPSLLARIRPFRR